MPAGIYGTFFITQNHILLPQGRKENTYEQHVNNHYFQPMSKAAINVTDADMFGLLNRVIRYVHMWEATISPSLITNGKHALYISSLLDRLAQRMKSDFYLIPVSVHGLIIHKKHDLFPLSFFKEALHVLKENIADPAEPLSNTIYIYSRNSHTIELCTQ